MYVSTGVLLNRGKNLLEIFIYYLQCFNFRWREVKKGKELPNWGFYEQSPNAPSVEWRHLCSPDCCHPAPPPAVLAEDGVAGLDLCCIRTPVWRVKYHRYRPERTFERLEDPSIVSACRTFTLFSLVAGCWRAFFAWMRWMIVMPVCYIYLCMLIN